MFFVSTDYVFDGSKSAPYETYDQVRPPCVYGRSKVAGEQQVREIFPEACILRSSWLFGAQGKCFANAILKQARARKTLRVVPDQRGSPTFNRDLASVIIQLARGGATGTLHAANAGNCSWFEFTQEVLQSAGLFDVTVVPISTAELNRPAPRPHYSVLSCASLSSFGITMRPWQEAVSAYLQEYLATLPAGGDDDAAPTKPCVGISH
jgi:dTDP-4-dehydrorhamnose reductase